VNMGALRWSQSRSVVRTAACEREEKEIAKLFEQHNERCREGAGCSVDILEDVLTRRIEMAISRPSIVWLSMPEKPNVE
jgi:hypothetical protein